MKNNCYKFLIYFAKILIDKGILGDEKKSNAIQSPRWQL